MFIKQLSIFVENKPGKMAEITRELSENNIDIRALSIADTTDYGILRLIVNDPDRAYAVLKEAGTTVSLTDVIAVALPDKPGGLHKVVSVLSDAGIPIEYMYAFLNPKSDTAFVIVRVDDNEKSAAVLKDAGIQLPESDRLYSM